MLRKAMVSGGGFSWLQSIIPPLNSIKSDTLVLWNFINQYCYINKHYIYMHSRKRVISNNQYLHAVGQLSDVSPTPDINPNLIILNVEGTLLAHFIIFQISVVKTHLFRRLEATLCSFQPCSDFGWNYFDYITVHVVISAFISLLLSQWHSPSLKSLSCTRWM